MSKKKDGKSFKQEARRDRKGSRKFRKKSGADTRGRPKPGTRSKCWVGAHKRKVPGRRKKARVKGHFRKISKGRKRG